MIIIVLITIAIINSVVKGPVRAFLGKKGEDFGKNREGGGERVSESWDVREGRAGEEQLD